MATATSTFSPYDRSDPSSSENNPTLTTQNRRLFTPNTNTAPPRPGQHLDDADLLAWKRQYANIGLREQNMMSNSAEDLSQLFDRNPYPFEVFSQDYNDTDDDELHLDSGNSYDYETVIQERLKKANEEFEHDQTPAELKHRQRVSFDAVVKAVDIVQDPQEHDNTDPLARPPVSPVAEEPSTSATSPQNENGTHQYTVPLNDTQPKEGPTLLQHIKAKQFGTALPNNDRWSSTRPDTTNGSSTPEDSSSTKPNLNNTNVQDNTDMTTKPSSQKSMVVSINGGFELQDEDDYTAKGSTKQRQLKFNDDDDDPKPSSNGTRVTFIPKPPTEVKKQQDSVNPQAPRRPYQSITRPKSSDTGKRTENSNSATGRSVAGNKNKSDTNNHQRPKSAGVSKSVESYIMRPTTSVDFDALRREGAEKKRAELREERLKKEKAKEEEEAKAALAKETFESWIRAKDAERKRLNEEKRMEKDEQEARQVVCEKKLGELREEKYQKWVARKNRDVLIAKEFRKLQAEEEEEIASGGSSSTINKANRRGDHRAFHRWIRRKDEQSKEERRQLRLESRRLRRRQRHSIKRFHLQQDLQLAKSFGYS